MDHYTTVGPGPLQGRYKGRRMPGASSSAKELSFCQVSLRRSESCFSGLAQSWWPQLAALKLDLFDNRSNGMGYGAIPVGMSWLHDVSDDLKVLFSGKW